MDFVCKHCLILRLDREECLADFPKEIIKQNQYILNLLHQFGNSSATNEKELEEVHFKLLGRCVCEDCLCVIYGLSDWRYERIKNFYCVSIFITHCHLPLKSCIWLFLWCAVHL